MSPVRRLCSVVAAAAIGLVASAAAANVYTVDYFPDTPQTSGLSQLRFVPSFVRPDFVGGTITNTRLVINFTTGTLPGGAPFDAAGLTLLIAGNVPDSPAGFWLVTGADLGWSGQGTFTADMSTADFNGTVANGAWQWDLSGPFGEEEIAPYAGTFSADSRVEITYNPVPGFCAADVNGSGDLTVQDIFDFLTGYFTDDVNTADINHSGDVTVQDIFDFLSAYFEGCS
jgi:hypothetical protein